MILHSVASIVFIYGEVRVYPYYWRYEHGYCNIRPLLMFSKVGDPVAVLPCPQPTEEWLNRLSRSILLQQFIEEELEDATWGAPTN
ncbi:hypothetical protein F4801DRAFT_565420, partial [Xylaria longipes]